MVKAVAVVSGAVGLRRGFQFLRDLHGEPVTGLRCSRPRRKHSTPSKALDMARRWPTRRPEPGPGDCSPGGVVGASRCMTQLTMDPTRPNAAGVRNRPIGFTRVNLAMGGGVLESPGPLACRRSVGVLASQEKSSG